jgi:hypothetical protein
MKKIYAILAFFMFLGFAGSAFAAAPAVTLQAASNITQNSATLSAVITSSTPINNIFEYGTDPSFGSNTQTIFTTSKSITASSLTANTTYYYRVSVSNSDGSTVAPLDGSGNPSYYSFKTTGIAAPYVGTLGADNITANGATLNGRINTNGASGSYYFRYYAGSSCASYLGNTSTQSINSSSLQYVTASLSGLSNNQTYCAELILTINGNDYSGGKVTFITKSGTVTPPPATCKITSFYADAPSVVYGGSTVIRWTTTGCTNANLNTLGGSVNLNDSKSVGPLYSNVTYVLNANSATNSDSQTLTITVGGVTPPTGVCKINSFSADSISLSYGDTTTLRWNTTDCTTASINTFGTVGINSTQSTGALYSGTVYTLYAVGTNGAYDTKTLTITVTNNGGGCQGTNCQTQKPSCYYTSTCYWNGTQWVYSNTGGCNTTSCGGGCTTNCGGATSYPGCYYTSACYWSGTQWVYSNNGGSGCTINCGGTTTYPSCYYNGTCSCSSYSSCTYYPTQTNPTYIPTYVPPVYTSPVYNTTYTQTPVQNYNYNPHTAYTGGPNYVTQKLPATVNTVYVDQPVYTQPNNQVVTQPVNTNYYGYYGNYDYTNDLMSRYANDYNYQNQNVRTNLLTGSAGSNNGVTLIGLLIILIIIAAIVYFVRSSQDKQLH